MTERSQLENLLSMFGMADSEVTREKVKEFLDLAFPSATHFSLKYDPEVKKYISRRFGPYLNTDSFFDNGFGNFLPISLHAEITELKCPFQEKIEDGEEFITVYWKDLLTEQELAKIEGNAEQYLVKLKDQLAEYKRLVKDEGAKADLLAAFDF